MLQRTQSRRATSARWPTPTASTRWIEVQPAAAPRTPTAQRGRRLRADQRHHAAPPGRARGARIARSGSRSSCRRASRASCSTRTAASPTPTRRCCALIGYTLRRDARPQDARVHRARPGREGRGGDRVAARRRPTRAWCSHKDGTRIPVEFIVRTMMRNGERLRMTIVRDIRDRHAAQARIHHLAHHDALTGLPNRAALQRAARAPDAGGARRGDARWRCCSSTSTTSSASTIRSATWSATRCCRRVAQRITASAARDRPGRRASAATSSWCCCRASTIARATSKRSRSKLLAAIEAPVDVDGRPISVTPSIGVAMFPRRRRTRRRADQARRHRDVPGQGARPRATTSSSTRRWPSAAYAALVIEERARAGARARRVRAALPAAGARARRRGSSAPRR